VARHVDAGYEDAVEFAKRAEVKIPMTRSEVRDPKSEVRNR